MTKKIIITLLGIIAISGLALAACSGINAAATATAVPTQSSDQPVQSDSVIAEAMVEPQESRSLYFTQPGTVQEVLVQKGDLVEAGQVLARLANVEPQQAALDGATLEVEQATQALDELKRTAELAHSDAAVQLLLAQQAVFEAQRAWDEIDTEATQDDIDQAKVDVAEAEKNLEDAQKEYDRYKDLPEDNASKKAAKADLDDAQQAYDDAVLKQDELVNAYETAQANLEKAQNDQAEAQHRFDQTLEGPDPLQLKLAELRLQAALSSQVAAQAAMDNLEIVAPFAGTIMDANLLANEEVTPGTWAFVLADLNQWYVRTSDLTELEVVQIENGQIVKIVPDFTARRGAQRDGAGNQQCISNRNRRYPVRCADPPGRLRPALALGYDGRGGFSEVAWSAPGYCRPQGFFQSLGSFALWCW